MTTARLVVMGAPRLERGNQPLRDPLPVKGLALLTYLALTGRPQSRSHLAGLLWGGLDDALARTNLRVVLHKLRRELPDQIEVMGDTIAIAAQFPSDAIDFERSIAEATPASLARAEKLYGGDLLQGVEIDDAAEFELWVGAERERLRELARELFHTLAENAAPDEAQRLAQRAISLAPWDEQAHLRLMRMHQSSGDSTAALAQYELLTTALKREIGAPPSAEAQALAQEIEQTRRMRAPAPAHALPEPATPFVGRIAEVAAIQRLLDSGGRLVTLIGPGGAGKTRLAIAAASARRDTYADGAIFVPLAGVSPARDDEAYELVLLNVASAVGLSFSATLNSDARPLDQLTAFLRTKTCLLLLDNFEQVRAAAPLLTHLMEAAPGVHFIVTSRERLGLAAEHVLDVAGLAFVATDAPISDAHALFVESARRVLPRFDAEPARAEIDSICGIVEGLPLCLEMAANWVRTLSCAQILERLRSDQSVLDVSGSNWPERHRSMRNVIESSWAMLDDDERRVFRRLSVLQGGFDAGAAHAVAQATLAELASLTDKSWLKPDNGGRFRVHELLRQHGAARLGADPDEAAGAERAHAEYFCGRLRAEIDAGQLRERAALADDRENLRAAWNWHLRAGVRAVERILPDLWRYYDSTASYQDAILMLQGALTLADAPPLRKTQWTRLLGEAHYQIGAANLGRLTIESALAANEVPIGSGTASWLAMFGRALAVQLGHRAAPALIRGRASGQSERLTEMCAGLRQLMHIYYFRGDEIPLAALILTYLNAAEDSRMADDMAFGYAAASIAFGSIGIHDMGDRYDRLARQHVGGAADPLLKARALQAIGVYNFGEGRIQQSKPFIDEAVHLYERNGGYRYYTECEEMLCEIAFYGGDYATSLRLASMPHVHSANDPLAIAMAAFTRAACAARMGEDPSRVRDELARLKLDGLEPSDLVCVYGALAYIHAHPDAAAHQGDLALRYARQAIEHARRTKMPAIYTLEGYGMLGDALLMLCENADVVEPQMMRDTEFVCDTLRKAARIYPMLRARASLADGRYARLTHDRSAATHFARARDQARSFGMVWECARAESALRDATQQPANAQLRSRASR